MTVDAIVGIVKALADLAEYIYEQIKGEGPKLQEAEVIAELERLKTTLGKLKRLDDAEWEEVGGRR